MTARLQLSTDDRYVLKTHGAQFWTIFAAGHCQKHPYCCERINACGRQADYAGYNARSVAWVLTHGVWVPRLNSLCQNIACVNPGHLQAQAQETVPALVLAVASQRLASILSD